MVRGLGGGEGVGIATRRSGSRGSASILNKNARQDRDNRDCCLPEESIAVITPRPFWSLHYSLCLLVAGIRLLGRRRFVCLPGGVCVRCYRRGARSTPRDDLPEPPGSRLAPLMMSRERVSDGSGLGVVLWRLSRAPIGAGSGWTRAVTREEPGRRSPRLPPLPVSAALTSSRALEHCLDP